MLILSSFRQIYQFGIAVPTGQDVGFDPYASDPLPCVVLPGATFRPLSRPVQYPVRLSGTPYGGQSPRRFPGVMLPRARFAVSQGVTARRLASQRPAIRRWASTSLIHAAQWIARVFPAWSAVISAWPWLASRRA